jgi:hypothetical protein
MELHTLFHMVMLYCKICSMRCSRSFLLVTAKKLVTFVGNSGSKLVSQSLLSKATMLYMDECLGSWACVNDEDNLSHSDRLRYLGYVLWLIIQYTLGDFFLFFFILATLGDFSISLLPTRWMKCLTISTIFLWTIPQFQNLPPFVQHKIR